MRQQLVACAVASLLVSVASARVLAQEHAGQYALADIQYGARVYGAQCSVATGLKAIKYRAST